MTVEMHAKDDNHYIILPDGRLEKADGRIPSDVPIETIVLPRVSSDHAKQVAYEDSRIHGFGHNISLIAAIFGRFSFGKTSEGSMIWCPIVSSMSETDISEVISLKYHQFIRYRDMRIDRQSHKIALMLATRKFPGVKSDSIFNEGKFSGESGRNSRQEVWRREQAESRGFSTNGKWYCSGLASYPGDPTAWVDSVSDVKRVASEKNMTIVDGYVRHKGHEVEPSADLEIDPRIVADETLDICESNPGAKYEDVYERVNDLRSGRVDPHPLLVSD